MKRRLSCTSLLAALVGVCLGAGTVGCMPAYSDDFESISAHGFDAADNAEDLNDYPWAMAYFTPDGSDTGQVYVGTGNGIVLQGIASAGTRFDQQDFYHPPEIRRYRPDLGPREWERVFDDREVEAGPRWETSGFRSMAVYRAKSDDRNYLYAGTLGKHPALWRSATGEAGSWEKVWEDPDQGSVRALAVHNGQLYAGITHDSRKPALPGAILATDGDSVWVVAEDGVSDPSYTGVYSLTSFNGWLYAGLVNRVNGYEVWKLAGAADPNAPPVRVVTGGGASKSNQATTQMTVFQGRLYVGALIYGGINIYGFPIRGADMIRINPDDTFETVVGPGSIGGVRSGFGKISNAYLWSLAEHKGKLYCGTWDAAAAVPEGVPRLGMILLSVWSNNGVPESEKVEVRNSGVYPYDRLTANGAELYVSDDGVQWTRVFSDGLGNPDNYGIRNMLSAAGTLYLGMANPVDGLEIWKMRAGD